MAAPTRATFAAGCYWGTEHFFLRHFKSAIVTHKVGFMGGREEETMSYDEVKKGTTGHAEVFDFTYDPSKTSYADLLAFFFRMHNSTTPNRQEGDIGTNYRSAIFYHTDEQKQEAEDYIAKLNGADEKLHSAFARAFGGAACITSVEKAGRFYPAHEAHQDYLEKNPNGYCAHRIYF
ncbi:putative peptide methionine sulfoxide reductase [Leptomonas pyrrhocoris]|uniref:peptide-methionine (S)-S-oxide reductase n=1 Tax=Leptomonas pyrrhocoris TaxID=157538 RepID=A0A0N0DRB8_LEPPY|nr:putative peptide methionine sulfoxide reductase [Leptomonas pyrrhocoris]XP_015652660.1 putative peptide methionine sulfoxide reductase [Leptomonas pyrrhocoris]XP_015652661.1 putative peptide methionine sulfoxide reductase [Leptomonas pyrrhocoris]KPA74220.1 putative peptide methionine sulfoxide reductase [Leptomonas pyrrhocoris]KPA74221.1 putative peptide methionine sulfoxide reductase [Leptomonas pyrrhocoris]KPA74222.1 putative peptide methionine sulfoxide reductase [Leptomonas pyrrhocoris]|eukprot:XP_015652659.1 putative peptide methionine sulfoxide reductase [Leptomonas pyrrhocoris]